MTHNCICTVVAMTRRRPSLDLSNEQCIVDINYWMSANWLKLNMDKTEPALGWYEALSLYGGWQLPIPAARRGYHRTKSTC